MTNENVDGRDRRARQRTWVAGGVLLLLSVAVGVAARGPLVGISPAKDWLFAGAAILFVVGLGRAGSVTGRRVVGSVAIVLLAVAPMTQSYWFSFIPDSKADPHLAEDVSVHIALTYYGIVATLAVISVVEIARAKVVPSGWRWAPMWVIVWTPIAFAIGLALFSSAPLGTAAASIGAIIGGHGPAAGIAFLGVLGIVLGVRQPARETAPDSDAVRTAT